MAAGTQRATWMNEIFIPIFPEGSLDSSVVTTVWIGLIVAALLNLRLGWVMSGVVVPGYLVPLLLIKPWAAVVVVFEAIVTYLAVWVVFEVIPRRGYWAPVFGRDRFFALLIASVLVRLSCDGFLLPRLGAWLTREYALGFDYRNNLHSFGLIIVALIANQLWKPGLRRGIVPLVTTVGLTWLAVRFVLMPFTNFSIGNLSYAYEDIAASMLASPKAYIILITTAYIASRMNLLYGWEYSGILLPSLLALVWYQPHKVAASLVESLAVLVLGVLVLRLSFFRNKSIEGARKLILFGTVSYAYKFGVAYAVLWFAPEHKVTDYFGFGYLLSTLIAMKMYDKEATARIARATLQTSFTAVAAASVLGFALTYLPNPWAWRPGAVATLSPVSGIEVSDRNLMDVVNEERIHIYESRMRSTFDVPLLQEMDTFSQAISTLLEYIEGGAAREALMSGAAELLRTLNYRVFLVENQYLCIAEMPPGRDWGFYAFNLKPKGSLLVEAPAPLAEKGAAESAAWWFVRSRARALAIAGGGRTSAESGDSSVLRNYQTLFEAFHRTAGRSDAVQVRGYSPLRLRSARTAPAEADSCLWVKASLPPSLNLSLLEQEVGDFRVEWGKTPFVNVQRDASSAGFAELVLNRRAMHRLLFDPLLSRQDLTLQVREQRVDGFLQDWLLEKKDRIAAAGSEGYVPARMEELLFFDEEVLTPLLNLSKTEYASGEWTDAGLDELRAAAASASVSGYQIIRYRHQATGHDYLILMERDDAPRLRHWGTYVFRLGQSNGYLVQVPRPIYEVNTFEYGVALFERLDAAALLIAGTSPLSNRDGSADVVQMRNKTSLFALVNQAILREARGVPMLAVQTRAFGVREDRAIPDCDVLAAFSTGVSVSGKSGLLGGRLVDRLANDGLQVRFVDGSIETARYETARTMLSLYTEEAPQTEFAILWLSPAVRAAYRQQTENALEAARFGALDIETVETDLYSYLEGAADWADSGGAADALRVGIEQYAATQDIVVLDDLVSTWPDYRLVRIIDLSSRQSFLAVYTPEHALMLIAGLWPRAPYRSFSVAQDALDRQSVLDFVEVRGMWLELKAAPPRKGDA